MATIKVEFNFLDFISTSMEESISTKRINEMIEELGMGNLLNLLLVHRNIRLAMLFQPIDYGEDNRNLFHKSGKILEKIQNYFPDLILSTEYENYQGVLISKQSFNGRTDISSEEMGRILGYPCYAGFSEFHTRMASNDTREYFGVDMTAIMQSGEVFQLYGCLCENFARFQSEFESFADLATELFQIHYSFLKVSRVVVHPIKISTVRSILDKLVKKETEELDSADISKIINIFQNCDFHILDKEFSLFYQAENPIHRGLLIGFLLNEQHNLLTPFFPMSPLSKEYQKVQQISLQWETDLIQMLIFTAVKKE